MSFILTVAGEFGYKSARVSVVASLPAGAGPSGRHACVAAIGGYRMKWLPLLTGLALLATACAPQSNDGSMAQSGQIDCTTAEADLRVLRSEQSHAMEQATGGRTMVPSGLVTEPEYSTGGPISAGEYSDYLGDRISRIEQTCGL
jgi:hypothetical protein